MKTVAGGILLALLLVGVAALSWSEAGFSERMAEAHKRLATLQYDDTVAVDSTASTLAGSRWRIPALSEDVQPHRVKVTYWLGRYQALTPMLDLTGQLAVKNSSILFAAANAAYRATNPEAPDHKAAAEQLDHVMQAFADVLRLDPSQVDASYNYEYVARVRDIVAKGKKPAHPAANPTDTIKADLPPGLTVHGIPGFPPPEINMGDFKTLTPMKYEEREEQTDPGRGSAPKRRG